MFALVQLLAYNDQPHPSKIIVPPKKTTKKGRRPKNAKPKVSKKPRLTLNDLVINDAYGFDKMSKTLLYPVGQVEAKKHKMR